MKTAVIYARYSSERQSEQSIDGQLRKCYEYAEQNGILVLDTYIDRAMTGTNDKRADFQRMLKDSNKKLWNYVIVYKIDRFGRNKYEIAMNKHALKANGIKLLSAMENIPDSPEGIILESLLEGMAEYYSAELSQKVKRGMRESRLKGNFTGGFLPYGYKKEGKKVVVDEDKAEIIRYIYSQYAQNVYVKDIITTLTKRGILNENKPFAKNTVHNILRNQKYSGIYNYDGEVFSDIYPQIVPDGIFQIVQAKNKSNQSGSRSPYVVHLLRKKIKCGYCGRNINGYSGTSKSGEVKRYYLCAGKHKTKDCVKKTVRKEALEEIVLQTILKLFVDKKSIPAIADKIAKFHNKNFKGSQALTLLRQKRDDIVKAKNNILSAIELGNVSFATANRLQELEKSENEISQKILSAQSKEKSALQRTEIISFFKNSLRNIPQRMIELLVKQIVLYDDKILIKCNYTRYSQHQPDSTLNLVVFNDKAQLPMTAERKYIIKIYDVDVSVEF